MPTEAGSHAMPSEVVSRKTQVHREKVKAEEDNVLFYRNTLRIDFKIDSDTFGRLTTIQVDTTHRHDVLEFIIRRYININLKDTKRGRGGRPVKG